MKAPKTLALTSALPLLLLIAGSAQAQVVDVSDCRQIEDSLKRFACYESLGGDQQPAAESAAPAAGEAGASASSRQSAPLTRNAPRQPASAAPEAPAAGDMEAFGRSAARIERDDKGKDELHDTIVKVERFTPNQWDVTLSNGQVWRQVTGKRHFLEKGDKVRIYSTMWGDNYRLSADNRNGYIEVRRLR